MTGHVVRRDGGDAAELLRWRCSRRRGGAPTWMCKDRAFYCRVCCERQISWFRVRAWLEMKGCASGGPSAEGWPRNWDLPAAAEDCNQVPPAAPDGKGGNAGDQEVSVEGGAGVADGIVKRKGPGRPKGSKNKRKIVSPLQNENVKRPRGRPRKNVNSEGKKSSKKREATASLFVFYYFHLRSGNRKMAYA